MAAGPGRAARPNRAAAFPTRRGVNDVRQRQLPHERRQGGGDGAIRRPPRRSPARGPYARDLRNRPRYRELRGNEAAIVRRLRADADGIKAPHFFRFKFTVDDPMAARLIVLPPLYREWAVRDAVEKTFAGALARAQGAFGIHYHGARAGLAVTRTPTQW